MNGAVNRLDTDKDGKITVYDFLQDKSKTLNFILYIYF